MRQMYEIDRGEAISFQTNLPALNASVKVARTGDAGAGIFRRHHGSAQSPAGSIMLIEPRHADVVVLEIIPLPGKYLSARYDRLSQTGSHSFSFYGK